MKTNIKNIRIKGSILTFDCAAGRGFKAIIDRRSRVPEIFAFSEDALQAAQYEGASFMGIVSPREICLCLLASGEIAEDECGSSTVFFHSKNKI